MSRPPLDLTPIVTNMENAKIYHIWTRLMLVRNDKPQATNTTNRLVKIKGRSVKIVRTREPGVRPIIVRLIIKQI